MAKWITVNALLRNLADEDKKEMLGIENLESEPLVKSVVIDLQRIESYAPSLDNEGEEIEDQVDLIMHSGLQISLKHSFVEIDKLVRKAG